MMTSTVHFVLVAVFSEALLLTFVVFSFYFIV